jgi:hypothetical protein
MWSSDQSGKGEGYILEVPPKVGLNYISFQQIIFISF